jgi:tetratricopeptide (TPR) repeat protein
LTFLARDHWLQGRAQEAADALEKTIRHAARTGDIRRSTYAAYWLSIALIHGHTPIHHAVARCQQLAKERPGVPLLEVGWLSAQAVRNAMNGSFSEAHAQCSRAVAILDDLGQKAEAAAMDALIGGAMVLRLAGDTPAMEAKLRHNLIALEDLGDMISASKAHAFLADALYLQNRLEEADAHTVIAEQSALADIDPQIRWRRVRAKVRARQGAFEEAEQLAREAVALALRTQLRNATADSLLDLGEVLLIRGQASVALQHVETAIKLYAEKGNVMQTRSADEFLLEISSMPVRDE